MDAVLTGPYQNQLIRQKLDSGLGDELFEKYRAAEQHAFDFGDLCKYLVVVFAAIMMRYGTTIKEDHIQHLRNLVPKIQCNEGTVLPIADSGFRGPGKRQFLAALDRYQAGKPRSFQEPSCHGCGRVNDDVKDDGKLLMKCGGCKNERAVAWFCDKVNHHCAPEPSSLLGQSRSTLQIPHCTSLTFESYRRSARGAYGSTTSIIAVLLLGVELLPFDRTGRIASASSPTRVPMSEHLSQ